MTDTLIITRTFDAPRARVFEAWTTPEQFARWWGTEAVDVPLDSTSMDVRVGGAWRADMLLPDGHVIHWSGTYAEVDPPARLAFTMSDDPDRPAGVPVVVELAPTDAGTEMTLTQTGSGFDDEQLERTTAGYHGFFDEMAKLLAR